MRLLCVVSIGGMSGNLHDDDSWSYSLRSRGAMQQRVDAVGISPAERQECSYPTGVNRCQEQLSSVPFLCLWLCVSWAI